MTEISLQEINSAVSELRKSFETLPTSIKGYEQKFDSLAADHKEKVSKIEGLLAEQEKQNQKLVASMEAKAKQEKEFIDRISTLERTFAAGNKQVAKGSIKESAEYKAFSKFMCKGESALTAEEMSFLKFDTKTLRTDDNANGGYLVPEAISSQLLEEVEEVSPVKQFANVITLPVKSLNVPIRKAIPTAYWEGEREASAESNSSYRNETLTAYALAVTIPATLDWLQFANYNPESRVMSDAALAFAQAEGYAFLLGTGDKQPQGLLLNANLVTKTTGSSGAISMDEVIQLIGYLKTAYLTNSKYYFNQTTLTYLRTLRDTSGQYLWRVGGESQPSTINGYKYVILPDMPSVAANNLAVGFGNLNAAYTILQSSQMQMIRDGVTQANKRTVLYHWFMWETGQVVIPEAMVFAKIKA